MRPGVATRIEVMPEHRCDPGGISMMASRPSAQESPEAFGIAHAAWKTATNSHDGDWNAAWRVLAVRSYSRLPAPWPHSIWEPGSPTPLPELPPAPVRDRNDRREKHRSQSWRWSPPAKLRDGSWELAHHPNRRTPQSGKITVPAAAADEFPAPRCRPVKPEAVARGISFSRRISGGMPP